MTRPPRVVADECLGTVTLHDFADEYGCWYGVVDGALVYVTALLDGRPALPDGIADASGWDDDGAMARVIAEVERREALNTRAGGDVFAYEDGDVNRPIPWTPGPPPERL